MNNYNTFSAIIKFIKKYSKIFHHNFMHAEMNKVAIEVTKGKFVSLCFYWLNNEIYFSL